MKKVQFFRCLKTTFFASGGVSAEISKRSERSVRCYFVSEGNECGFICVLELFNMRDSDHLNL